MRRQNGDTCQRIGISMADECYQCHQKSRYSLMKLGQIYWVGGLENQLTAGVARADEKERVPHAPQLYYFWRGIHCIVDLGLGLNPW